jgi:hypothetical protein
VRVTRLAAALLVAACSDGVAPRPLMVDVDGDGRPEPVTMVESGPRGDPGWRYGVRAEMTTAGAQTAWAPAGSGGNPGRALAGSADVNADGRYEVAVRVGRTGAATLHALVTFDGSRLVLLDLDLWTGRVNDEVNGWYCADGLLHTTEAGEREGARLTRRLAGDRFEFVVPRRTRQWPAGTTPPPPFGATLNCGDITL